MKFTPTRETVISTNETKGFSMAINAKSFSILTSGIYTNKIKAIIREYSTNAIDAHLESGVITPIQVHLPTVKEPYFFVRDYGFGLDEDQFENVFFKFFESTKDQSNAYNGTMGLGSKSFASYNTKSCTVESIKDNKKFIYAAFIGKSGCPERSLLYSGECDEPSGLKIQIPVNMSDIEEFEANAKEVYKWFTFKPEFVGKNIDVSNGIVSYTDNCVVTNTRGCFAVMSNVAYPITEHYALSNYSHLIRSSSIALLFDNGEISFTPSRESLEYTERTISAIKNKIEAVIKEINQKITDEVASSKTEWQAICNYNHLYETYNSKVHGIKLNKVDDFDFNGTTLNSKSLDLVSLGDCLHIPEKRSHRSVGFLLINKNINYVIDDLKVGAISRSKLLAQETGELVYLLSKELYDKIPYTKDESDFILASTLPKPVRNATSYVRSKFTELNLMKDQNRLIDAWEGIETKNALSKYYILKNGYRPAFYGDHQDINMDVKPSMVYRLAKAAGITDPIYGVVPKNEQKIIDLGFIKIQDAINDSYVASKLEIESKKDFINKYNSIRRFLRINSTLINNIIEVQNNNYTLPSDLQLIFELNEDFRKNEYELDALNTKIDIIKRSSLNYQFERESESYEEYTKIVEKYPICLEFDCGDGYNNLNVLGMYHYIMGVNFVSSQNALV